MPQPPKRKALGAVVAGVLAGAPALGADAPPHHRPGGFQNNHIAFTPKSVAELLRWRLEAWRAGLPAPAATAVPTAVADLAYLHANARAGAAMEPAVTWVGHATVLAQFDGVNLLTDPVFSERASPLAWLGPRRVQPPALAIADLPHIDLVLISHNHYDHLDEASVKALAAQDGGSPLFVVPLGLKAWLAGVGVEHVVELDWWQGHRIGALEVVLTPAQHWSGRGLHDRMQTLWGGFAVFAPAFHLFWAGDTGYSPDFDDIRRRFAHRQGTAQGGGFDLALLPVGAYEPRWFMAAQHADPAEAVQIHRDLGAKRSLGVHWGTFQLTDESLDTPPAALAAACRAQGVADDAFFVLPVGGTRVLPRR